jgi:Bacterial Ig domain/Cellulose binding domain/Calx-beta domain
VSGFQAQINITNSQTSKITNWQLQFDLAANISSIWDARIVSHSGNQYVIAGASWDANLPASGSVSYGFVASPGHVAAPSNYVLNGVPLGGSSPPVVPALSIGDASGSEGNGTTTIMAFSVSLSTAATSPVTVQYSAANGTAVAGADYQATSGTLTFPPGVTQKTITVSVLDDTLVDPNESFVVTLANPLGATLARPQAFGTIVDNDAPATPGNIQFQVTNDWGTGFNGQVTVRNTGTTPLTGWTLSFIFPVQISSIWNATIVSHVGNQYVLKSAGWNDIIVPGASASFGFSASPGGATLGPTNYVLQGNTTGGGGLNHNPTAANDTAWTYVGQPVTISVLANDSDPDGDSLAVVSFTQGKSGAVSLKGDGTLTYTPSAGFSGPDSFTYVVSDGQGGTATGTVAVTVANTPAQVWPDRVFAPYVDMTLYPVYDLAAASTAAELRYFTLAFIVADASKQPSWGGYTEYAVNGGAYDLQMRSQIAAVRSQGGDVMVSFGGAANRELAEVITSVSALEAAYQAVVNAYNLTHIDFDIEGAAVADHASIDRRSQALAALQRDGAAAGKPIQIWFTLPVLPTGLTNDGLYVLQSAIQYGVQIGGVNIMTMDYGDSAAPNPAGKMGTYAIQAATSLFNQLKGLYGNARTDAQLWKIIGVTPMIGLNDVTTEIDDQAAAMQLVTFAEQKGIGRISMWLLNRDQQNKGGVISYVDTNSSSVFQKPYEFSQIFLVYAK